MVDFMYCLSVCVRFALQHLDLLIPRNIWHARTDACMNTDKNTAKHP